MLVEVFLGAVISFGIFIWWCKRSARLYWEKNGVSYIAGPPLVGVFKDALIFKKSFGDTFLELYNHEKFKDDAVSGVYFFHKPCLLIRHPEIIKNILVKDFSNFVDRNINSDPHTDGIGRYNLFSVKGIQWKKIRQRLSPIFTTGKLKHLFLLMVDVTKTLEQKLTREIKDAPREYEMKQITSLFAIDTISICAFGVQANSLLNPRAEFHENAKKAFHFKVKRALELYMCFFSPELSTIMGTTFFSPEFNDFVRSSINYVIDERERSGAKRNDLIDVLIEMKKEDSEFFKGDTLVAQAAAFLVAGNESSSSAVAFTLYELARHPDSQEQLRTEIKEYMAKYGSVQYETINEMEYLNCVVQEILRLYPALPFLDRTCVPINEENSYSLEPYHSFSIPKGMPVCIPHVAIQRDPKFFPNPLEFKPERFNAENRDSFNQYTFLTFGIGPRNCIGARFGYLQIKLAIITILNNYRVTATERTPKIIEFNPKSLFVYSQQPLYMNLERI